MFAQQPVHHQAQIEFLADVGAFFDEKPAHLLAFRAGLMGDELHAQDGAGVGLDLVQRLGHLDTAALAAATGVDLRLHDPDRPAQALRNGQGFVNRKRRLAARYGHAVTPEDFLALVFVNLHWDSPSTWRSARNHRG